MNRLVVVMLLVGCQAEPVADPVIRPVRTEVAHLSGAELRGTFSGVAEAGDEATLSFATGGTIEDVVVKIGDRVKAGAVLARLDDTQLQLQVGQARASLAQAAANLTLAKQSLDRTEALYINDNASAAELESARANHASAAASHSSASRSLSIARDQLDGAILEANRDGSVSAVLVTENENVGGGTPVVVLTPEQQLQVTVAVPGRWVGRLASGHPATARFKEIGNAEITATVTEVGVTGESGSFSVTVELDQLDARIRPGMGSDVSFVVEASGEQQLELPLSAVGEDSDGRHVWVVEETGNGAAAVKRVAVTTGDLMGDRIVVDGVEPGARVVTAGVSLLFEGRPVRVQP